ncbi:multiple RNA-binding domain-containing protein 1 [Nematocida sp. AWRm80]|nr:multiple RNA-binding domain-containing protein 1 [Nematocida sp. AWRm80]
MRTVLKNLPTKITEEMIRKDFSHRGTITDVRLLTSLDGKSRRTAFVGYKTLEEANKSIIYYNKSYYNGQRIIMEPVTTTADKSEVLDDYKEKRTKALAMTGIDVEEMKEIVKLITAKRTASWSTAIDEIEPANKKQQEESVEETIQKYRTQLEEEKKQKVLETGEVFVQGIPYTATEAEVESFFAEYGMVAEVYLKYKETEDSWGDGTRLNCGFAIVTFVFPKDAFSLFGKEIIFQGRKITVTPSKGKPKQEITGKNTGNHTHGKYNALFFNFTAILGAAAKEKKLTKQQILKDRGTGLGGRIALLQSELVERTKKFVKEEGIAVECTCQKAPCTCMFVSKKSILIKNLPHDVTETEIRKYFKKQKRIIFSPNRALAILEYATKSEAQQELKANNFAQIRNTPIYIEYVKVTKERYTKEMTDIQTASTILEELAQSTTSTSNNKTISSDTQSSLLTETAPESAPESTKTSDTAHIHKIILKNVPFQAGRSELSEMLNGLIGTNYKLRMPKKPDGTHRGFCFVEVTQKETKDLLISKTKHLHLYGRHIIAEQANV